MDKYNALFRHLLRLKRVSMELEAAWAASGQQQSMPAGAHQGAHQHLWQARHNMTHLISNLQIYMQVYMHLSPHHSYLLEVYVSAMVAF